MRILVIHQGFPGQFKHLIPAMQARGDQIWAISAPRHQQHIPAGVHYKTYYLQRTNGIDTLPLASELETKLIRAEAVAKVAADLAKKGFQPDLILGHPGWGEMYLLADIWPKVPQLHYVEFFHGVPGTDDDIDDIYAKAHTWESKARARVKNTHLLANLNEMHAGISPTQFQHSLLPKWARARTTVIHEGIDTDQLSPNPNASLQIHEGPLLKAGDPIITFVNRSYEPYRGVHIFLEALAQLQAIHPTFQAVLVGADTPKVSYGARRMDNRGWLTVLREQLGNRLDWRRIHPLGQVPHKLLRDVYQVSAAHVYLSYPFVLSWSMLEAMSCGALIVGSDTAPVREMIQHGHNGLLVPFSNSTALTSTLHAALLQQTRFIPLRHRGRQHIKSFYQRQDCINRQLKLVDKVVQDSTLHNRDL